MTASFRCTTKLPKRFHHFVSHGAKPSMWLSFASDSQYDEERERVRESRDPIPEAQGHPAADEP